MNGTHEEEKVELNTTIAELEKGATDQSGLAERLEKLELLMETRVSERWDVNSLDRGNRHVSG